MSEMPENTLYLKESGGTRSSGFSLVEVLIALLIVIISVVSLLSFLTLSLEVNSSSTKIAESLLVEAGELEIGQNITGDELTISVGGVNVSGRLLETEYGKSKRLIEFVRSK